MSAERTGARGAERIEAARRCEVFIHAKLGELDQRRPAGVRPMRQWLIGGDEWFYFPLEIQLAPLGIIPIDAESFPDQFWARVQTVQGQELATFHDLISRVRAAHGNAQEFAADNNIPFMTAHGLIVRCNTLASIVNHWYLQELAAGTPAQRRTKTPKPSKRTLAAQLEDCGSLAEVHRCYYPDRSDKTVYAWATEYELDWKESKEARGDRLHRLR